MAIHVQGGGGASGTAKANQVLQDTTFSNDDDIDISGTMVDRSKLANVDTGLSSAYPNSAVTVSTDLNLGTNTDGVSRINIRPKEGYYGASGTWLSVPATSFGDATQAQVLKDKTFTSTAGVKKAGTMVNVGSYEDAKSIAVSGDYLYIRMTNGAHITNASSGYPEVRTAKTNFGNATAAKVVSGNTFTSSAGLKVSGTLANATNSRVTSNKNNQTGTQSVTASVNSKVSAIFVCMTGNSIATNPTVTAVINGNTVTLSSSNGTVDTLVSGGVVMHCWVWTNTSTYKASSITSVTASTGGGSSYVSIFLDVIKQSL